MGSASLIIVGSDEIIDKFEEFLKSSGVKIKVGLRSSSTDGKSTVHLVIGFSSASIFSSVISNWFGENGDSLIISGDKDALGLAEMDEVVLDHSDSLSIIRSKVDALVDRQLFSESVDMSGTLS